MAAMSTGITTTSMFVTPQAVDDFYFLNEDSGAISVLDVMANDLGGAAKTLWSTTTGSEWNPDLDSTDLISRDLAGVYETTELGARVAIRSDGKLSYDTTLIAARLNGLGQGEMMTDHVTYAIRLANGTLSLATMTVTIYGTNDGPVIGSTSDLLGGVIEPGVGEAGDLIDSGSLAASDADVNDTLVWSGDADGAFGHFDVTDAGAWTYTLDPDLADSLAGGAVRTESFAVTVTDGHGATATTTVEITVHGTNDAPTANGANLDVDEDATASGNVTGDDVDSDDDGSSLIYTLVNPAPAGLTFNPDGSYSFDASSYDSLAAGEDQDIDVQFTTSDSHGATSAAAVLTIHVHGANDAVTIGAGTFAGSVTEDVDTGAPGNPDTNQVASGSFAFGDVDTSDTHTASLTSSTAGFLGTFTVNPISNDSTTDGAGVVSWSFSVANADLQSLGSSSHPTQTYTITVDDGHGGSVTQNVVITLNGVDEPVTSITIPAVVTTADPNDHAGGGDDCSELHRPGK